ncbi:hypothetical protein [Halobacterium yunchengense]|uniref:hypothetical protein n=1 Tax=Halobacterium yunchengense TaxID=3108497 RepID=UPI00300B1416
MRRPDSPSRAATLAAAALSGAVPTAVAAVAALAVLQPLQVVVYDAYYRLLGPWTATTAATVVHLGVGGALAAAVPVVAVELLAGVHGRRVATGAVAVVALLAAVLLVSAYVGVVGLLTVVVAYLAFGVAAVAALAAADTAPATTAAFAGTAPVLAFLLVLLAVGLGWGGGYDVVAEPTTADSTDDPVADFDDAPRLAADLFAASACDPREDGVCRLSLRGYAGESAAARFLDDRGVRCPYVNAPAATRYDRDASFVAEHDGAYYRISCQAYGD